MCKASLDATQPRKPTGMDNGFISFYHRDNSRVCKVLVPCVVQSQFFLKSICGLEVFTTHIEIFIDGMRVVKTCPSCASVRDQMPNTHHGVLHSRSRYSRWMDLLVYEALSY